MIHAGRVGDGPWETPGPLGWGPSDAGTSRQSVAAALHDTPGALVAVARARAELDAGSRGSTAPADGITIGTIRPRIRVEAVYVATPGACTGARSRPAEAGKHVLCEARWRWTWPVRARAAAARDHRVRLGVAYTDTTTPSWPAARADRFRRDRLSVLATSRPRAIRPRTRHPREWIMRRRIGGVPDDFAPRIECSGPDLAGRGVSTGSPQRPLARPRGRGHVHRAPRFRTAGGGPRRQPRGPGSSDSVESSAERMATCRPQKGTATRGHRVGPAKRTTRRRETSTAAGGRLRE